MCSAFFIHAQPGQGSHWTKDGNGFYTIKSDEIFLKDLLTLEEKVVITRAQLTPTGRENSLPLKDYAFSNDGKKLLIFTNAQRVWRYETRGDYWVLNIEDGKLEQLGKGLAEATLMFAKFSPDFKKVAYVSQHNIYVEDLISHKITKLTSTQGTPKLINGTFDWAYEEEFSCLDGFRWSPDGKSIAYWQIDANTIKDFYMINNVDSIYAFTIPVEYPKVGESPSACRIGVVDLETVKTKWMDVPGDNRQNYIPRMEWVDNSNTLIFQQLNRKQNESRLMYADAKTGSVSTFYKESDEAWISIRSSWENGNGWHWIENGNSLVWVSEKDGWRHLYKISKDGKKEELVTKGNYDIISPEIIDEKQGYIYFTASPANATEKYLYRIDLHGKEEATQVTPAIQEGTHSYQISPNGKYAYHSFSNYFTYPMREWVSLPDHKALNSENSIAETYDPKKKETSNIEFFQVTTDDGIEMDGWIAKPKDFDPTAKYPVLFNVYSEPAGQTVINRFGTGRNMLYNGDMAEDGYIYMSVEGRGAPAPKGREWRKSIYRKIGIINIRDQAMATKKIIETFPYIDAERIAVHGWSGGGSATLNLLFQYPDLYQTGIAVAAVANQLTYDNIYQERYMGLPQENMDDFIQGSPITYAKNLKGNLLYIHGTGDDNVHYQNAEMLVNELIKHNKQFQFMPYPNRSHGIYEGEGTRKHLSTLFTSFLNRNCPPGARPSRP
jgi:dipeptidyl-peptidase-4